MPSSEEATRKWTVTCVRCGSHSGRYGIVGALRSIQHREFSEKIAAVEIELPPVWAVMGLPDLGWMRGLPLASSTATFSVERSGFFWNCTEITSSPSQLLNRGGGPLFLMRVAT